MVGNPNAIDIERATERIRQERETFDQRKRQDSQWFILKLIMGFTSIIFLAVVLFISTYILFNNKQYPTSVVTSAGCALFVDVLGLIISVWKIVLNPSTITKLEPLIREESKSFHKADYQIN